MIYLKSEIKNLKLIKALTVSPFFMPLPLDNARGPEPVERDPGFWIKGARSAS